MSINATQAAAKLQQQSESISPYQVITLLLEGALERLQQAKDSVNGGETEQAEVLIRKIIGIVNGLRGSLDMEKGGAVAANLDSLYEYIVSRLERHSAAERLAVLGECTRLIGEIKNGWDGIAESEPVAACG
ncbi:MAG: flagellar export chaperone FliS [Exilibacterium sp.]